MFPRTRLRLVIGASILLGAAAWLSIASSLRAVDGQSGFTLIWSSAGLFKAVLLVLAAGIPALLLGLGCSALGNPLSGLFVVGMSLLPLAWKGGPIDGWLRSHTLPGDYHRLLAECLMWEIGLLCLVAFVQSLRDPLHAKLPAFLRSWASDENPLALSTKGWPQKSALAAGGLCTLVALAATHILVQSSSNNQVLCSLVLAFSLGGLAGHMAFPKANPLIMLLSPGLVGSLAYSFILLTQNAHTNILAQWYSGHLTGLALVLPIQYISAGLAGTALGIGWAQGLMADESQEKESAQTATTTA